MNIGVRTARAWIIPALVFFFLCGFAHPLPGSSKTDTIKIGLLVQDKSRTAAYKAAILAVNTANRAGGINGHPVKIVLKSMEGPWGTGSKQAVDLVFRDKVTALLGSTDGRNAHLVEQVAAKSKVPFISAWSSDPTLAQAFVPWFFNCVPGDLQQAEALIEQISENNGGKPLIMISDTLYDSASAVKNFLRITGNNNIPQPESVIIRGIKPSFAEAIKAIGRSGSNTVLIFVQPSSAPGLTSQILKNYPGVKIYASLGLLDENIITDPVAAGLGAVNFAALPGLSDKAGADFSEEYMKTYGSMPGPVAAYAFDAMNILIWAIRTGGTGEEQIQKKLMQTRMSGTTGIIQFDERGSRQGRPAVARLKINDRQTAK